MVNKQSKDIALDVGLCIVGAVLGGAFFNALGFSASAGLNLWSVLVAGLGAAVLLVSYHAIRGAY